MSFLQRFMVNVEGRSRASPLSKQWSAASGLRALARLGSPNIQFSTTQLPPYFASRAPSVLPMAMKMGAIPPYIKSPFAQDGGNFEVESSRRVMQGLKSWFGGEVISGEKHIAKYLSC